MNPTASPMRRRWIVVVGLAAGLIAAWLAAATPRPQGVDAPAAEFSAGRAMADVRAVAARPHPSGSAELVRVRHHILSRLQAMGIAAEVQAGEGVLTAAKHKPGVVIAGAVSNIVGVLPGRDRTAPAVLVMAHYDTMPNTPGAGDDTAGVASALEIARAVSGDAVRARDVIFLFTDGEEPGLLGAQAFFASHPLARRVGVAINMEARGDTGRVMMFETSRGSGALVRLVEGKAPHPSANSLLASLYRVMPNDTDLTIALEHGVAGMNFAFAGDQLAYHTSLSTPEHLDAGSVQHMGDQVLPLVRALARARELPGQASDLVYSDLMGLALIAYPSGVGWGLCALAAAAVATSFVVVRRRGLASWGELGRGAAGLLFSMLAAALCLHLGGRWLGGEDSVRVYALVARYPLLLAGAVAIAVGAAAGAIGAMARGVRRLPVVIAVALAGAACSLGGFDLAGAVVAALLIGLVLLCLGRPTSIWGLWIGALGAGLAAAVLVQGLASSAAFLVQWPLLLAAATALALLLFKIDATSVTGLAILGVVVALGLAQIGGWAGAFFVQMGPVAPELLAVFLPLALFLAIPGAHVFSAGRLGRIAPVVLLVLGAGLLALVGSEGWAGASPRRLTQLFYLADPAERSFHHASATKTLDPWSRSIVGAGGAQPVSARMPLVASGGIWLGPAAPADVQGPSIEAKTDGVGEGRRIVLRVRPGASGRQLKLLIQPVDGLSDLTLNGRPMDALREAAALSLNRIAVVYTAPPAAGLEIAFRGPAHGRFAVSALEFRDGWPAGGEALPPRPPALLTWGLSDTTVIESKLDYAW